MLSKKCEEQEIQLRTQEEELEMLRSALKESHVALGQAQGARLNVSSKVNLPHDNYLSGFF